MNAAQTYQQHDNVYRSSCSASSKQKPPPPPPHPAPNNRIYTARSFNPKTIFFDQSDWPHSSAAPQHSCAEVPRTISQHLAWDVLRVPALAEGGVGPGEIGWGWGGGVQSSSSAYSKPLCVLLWCFNKMNRRTFYTWCFWKDSKPVVFLIFVLLAQASSAVPATACQATVFLCWLTCFVDQKRTITCVWSKEPPKLWSP